MVITQELRVWLVKRLNLPDGKHDAFYRDALAEALGNGALTANEFRDAVFQTAGNSRQAVIERVKDGTLALPQTARQFLIEKGFAQHGGADAYYQFAAARALEREALTIPQFKQLLSGKDADMNTSTDKAFGGTGTTETHIRVKSPSEMYKSTRVLGKHIKTGEPILTERGTPAELPSQLDYAKAGVMFKFWAKRHGISQAVLSDHEKDLLAEIFEKDTWCGKFENQWQEGIAGTRVKALLSDSTSGGAEVNPEWFDAAVIVAPLLNGELYPFVDIQQVPRGSAVETASVGNPTVSWGIAEGSTISLFNTDSLVTGIDTSIHPVAAAIEVGRDFMADAAVNIGQVLTDNLGQRMAAEFDRVIAIGNGTTQPTGIFTASGVTVITKTGSDGSAATVDDFENLVFGIGKQYRRPMFNCAFVSNDVTYKRARQIPVDSSSDARRMFGMDHQSYRLLEHDYRIEQNINNAYAAFGALKTYRIYRRAGIETRVVTEDATLARQNKVLFLVRARIGGRIMDTNAWAKCITMQA